MMEKQHNRGQEGAGIASVSLKSKPGTEYMFREKAEGKDAITEIFSRVTQAMAGELLMGHLRYSTTGKSGLTFVHPFLRRNNWRAKNLCLCGNFNMTNIDEVFEFLTQQGQSPRIYGDSYITLELMGHRLDREVERLYQTACAKGLEGTDITDYIEDHIEVSNVLKTTMSHYDGGYVMCGLTGSGEMFVVRDPWGIRPAFYYRNDEIIAIASERPVLQTTFDLQTEDICELQRGQALIVHKNGESLLEQILPARPLSACSFERIYFSRGSDQAIYQERKCLGEQLTPAIMQAITEDVAHTVFSYILYFHKAPSARDFHEETVRKLGKLYLYDCLRANKSLSAWGVEGRVPFLDKEFLDVAMRTNPEAKMCPGTTIEKKIVREAFADLLPEAVAWRQKEQFSDGVGYSWIDTLKQITAEAVSDEQMAHAAERFPINPPKNKEEYYYRSIFAEHFPSESAARSVPSEASVACSTAIALEWDAAFRNLNDPSGRAVKGVHEQAY